VAALTTTPPGEQLRDGLVYCLIRSWLTGRRIVSLPFSDHCEPLAGNAEGLGCLLAALRRESDSDKQTHVEVRLIAPPADVQPGSEALKFCLHRLSLRRTVAELFGNLHKDCVRRKIRRAQREGLVCDQGRTDALLEQFYQLLLMTRRRQGIPPQPMEWFRNLIACMGSKLSIRVALKDRRPVASILTLRFRNTLFYKYGCSDRSVSNLGGMQLLLWNAIKDATEEGLLEFDMGRSDWHDRGLIEFKDRWGACRSELAYLQYPTVRMRPDVNNRLTRIAGQLLSIAPRGLITGTSRLIYRHLG
jgi:hypothetical protein